MKTAEPTLKYICVGLIFPEFRRLQCPFLCWLSRSLLVVAIQGCVLQQNNVRGQHEDEVSSLFQLTRKSGHFRWRSLPSGCLWVFTPVPLVCQELHSPECLCGHGPQYRQKCRYGYADQKGNLTAFLWCTENKAQPPPTPSPTQSPASLLASGHGGYYSLSSYRAIITICVHSFHCHIFQKPLLILFKAWRMEDNNSWDKQMALFRSVSLTFQLHLYVFVRFPRQSWKPASAVQRQGWREGLREGMTEGGKEHNKILDT